MALLRIDGPAVEPVTLAEAKHHLRVDSDDDDTLIASLVTAARVHIEQTLGRMMVAQTWIDVRDAWPLDGAAVCPRLSPVVDVIEIRVVDAEGTAETVPEEIYFLDRVSDTARLFALQGGWPAPGRRANGIEIEFVAGYGSAAADVPEPLRQAVLLLASHWYEHREPIALDVALVDVPHTVGGLLAPYRAPRIAP